MKYRNTRTGQVIDVSSIVHGDAWEPLVPARKVAPVQPEKSDEPESVQPVKKKPGRRQKAR